jgi:Zn-dependent M32 family carboxypeptidase
MASQLQLALLEHLGGGGEDGWDHLLESSEVAQFLTQRLYRQGKSADWRGAVRNATGAALNPAAFVAELAARD